MSALSVSNRPGIGSYELEVELALFYPKTLIRRWGKIGTRRLRELHGRYDTPEELTKTIQAIRRPRIRHGYRCVRSEPLPSASFRSSNGREYLPIKLSRQLPQAV